MPGKGFHGLLLLFVLAATLTVGAPDAFPAPASRAEALAALDDPQTERRAEGVVWLANHGRIDDQPLLLKRLHDESAFVRGFAEQGLWLLWARSGEAEIDRLMATGVDQMQAGRHREAIATFSEVIRRKPDFAEGWNKRATVH
jgi:Flp pilus assembly protein TadD